MAQQASDSPAEPPNPGEPPASSNQSLVPPTFADPPGVTAMEEPQPGDYWTFESRDEITGKLTGSRTFTVTEATPVEITVRVSAPGGGSDLGLMVFDRSWNLKSASLWTYSPNDGQGIKAPLRVGASWGLQERIRRA